MKADARYAVTPFRIAAPPGHAESVEAEARALQEEISPTELVLRALEAYRQRPERSEISAGFRNRSPAASGADNLCEAPIGRRSPVRFPAEVPPEPPKGHTRKLKIGVIDLVAKAPTRALYARVMNANLASIMPQVVATWCEAEGHEVTFVCYTGFEDLLEHLPESVDLVFFGGFTDSAFLSYSLSNLFRSRGAVTVLGGPHARCYPEDARRYFDYVLGFTDRKVIREVLEDAGPHRPLGRHLSALTQPASLPGVRERWKFIAPTLRKAPLFKLVPMIGSLGCPYTCSFCIDATVPYQPLDFGVMREDLRFLVREMKRPRVGWHDPNFGVRFDAYLDAIDEAVPPGSIDFVAESSLSLLSEPHVQRMARSGFKGLLPGVESWYDMGNKSKTGQNKGIEKVRQVADHANMILKHIPYLQMNFVLGLDSDAGEEPFELTKQFIGLAPGVFPGYSLLSAFGRAAPLNLEYQRTNRVLPFPFHFLDNNHAMNVRPQNYSWPEFYDRVIDLTRHTFSTPAVLRRFRATRAAIPRWMNLVRAVSSEGAGRLKYYRELRGLLDDDPVVRRYFAGDSTELPAFYMNQIRRDLGSLWEWLPEGAIHHDPNAYLAAEEQQPAVDVPAAVLTPAGS